MNADDAPPRILLLEDDPVSAAFLVAALETLPACVDVAASLAEAEALRDTDHALWLFDANLPDGTGSELLGRWRTHGLTTPALAHTADARREELDALIAAGFSEVLQKPLSVALLQGTVRRMLGDGNASAVNEAAAATCAKSPVWDDDAALRVLNGNAAHVATMRTLFIAELPTTQARIANAVARSDVGAVRAELHKLQAACGFVGAGRIFAAVEALRDRPWSRDAFVRFDGAIEDTLSFRAPLRS